MRKIPIILNVDTGIDDAVAIGMAIFCNKFDIKLIVTSFGNTESLQVMKNTKNLLNFWDKDIPIVIGANKPFKRRKTKLINVHGANGLGSFEFEKISYEENYDFLEKMKQVIEDCGEKITLVSLATLTNFANLFEKYPYLVEKVEEIVFMSGSIDIKDGGVPYMEFNGSADPEACEKIISLNVPLLMCPMEMGHIAYLDWQDVVKTKYMNKSGEMFEKIFRDYKDRHVNNGIATHDGCCVACLSNQEIFNIVQARLNVQYYDETKTGVIVCDFDSKNANARVCTKVNVKKFKNLYFNCLKKMK